MERSARAFPDDCVNVEAVRRIAVSKKFRFLYNRIQKNANSHLIVVLNFLENGRLERVIRSRNRVPHLSDLSDNELRDIRNYRRLLVVRSPYSRTLSAFLDRFSRDRFQQKFGETSLDPDGFRKFVRLLDDVGLDSNSHWSLQGSQILLPIDRYTDIVRFEDLYTGILAFLTSVGVDSHRLSQTMEMGRDHSTNASEKLRHFYDRDLMDAVAKLCRQDFKELGYDSDRLI